MTIHRMKLDDLEQVVSLAFQLGYPTALADIQARFAAIAASAGYALFVARSDSGHVLGYVQVNCEPLTLLAPARAEVTALVVDERQRGKQVGASLLKHAEQWANENHLCLMRVRSNVKREAAHKFYQRHGYALQKSWHVFEKTLTHPESVMHGDRQIYPTTRSGIGPQTKSDWVPQS